MKQMQMEAQTRTALKKGAVGRSRLAGNIPAVLYGPGETNLNLELDGKKISPVLQTPGIFNTLIKLIINGDQPRQETVMIKSLQRHPVTEIVMHVDFVRISMDRPLETKIPVVLTGAAPGVKEGGILELVHRELHIRCLPSLIPENITLDVSELNIGDAISMAKITVPEGVEVLEDLHEPVVHVVAPKAEEVKPAAEVVGEVVAVPEVKEPEVIGEKEREERRNEKLKKEKEKE